MSECELKFQSGGKLKKHKFKKNKSNKKAKKIQKKHKKHKKKLSEHCDCSQCKCDPCVCTKKSARKNVKRKRKSVRRKSVRRKSVKRKSVKRKSVRRRRRGRGKRRSTRLRGGADADTAGGAAPDTAGGTAAGLAAHGSGVGQGMDDSAGSSASGGQTAAYTDETGPIKVSSVKTWSGKSAGPAGPQPNVPKQMAAHEAEVEEKQRRKEEEEQQAQMVAQLRSRFLNDEETARRYLEASDWKLQQAITLLEIDDNLDCYPMAKSSHDWRMGTKLGPVPMNATCTVCETGVRMNPHHCRWCGDFVCGEHSQGRHKLKTVSPGEPSPTEEEVLAYFAKGERTLVEKGLNWWGGSMRVCDNCKQNCLMQEAPAPVFPAPAAGQFPVGTRVEVHGLTLSPERNGRTGSVVEILRPQADHRVKFDDGKKPAMEFVAGGKLKPATR